MEFFTKYLTGIKIAAALALLAAACYGTWYVTSDHYQKVIDDNQIAADKAVKAQLLDNQNLQAELLSLRKSAEEDRAKNQLLTNTYAAKLGSVQFHYAGCQRALSQAGTATQDPDGSAGVADQRINTDLANAKRQFDAIVNRCAALNNDAIEANNSVKR